MRRSNIDNSIDLNKMPYLCKDCKVYLEMSHNEEYMYQTPPSSPPMETMYVPETPEEIYSCYKERCDVISHPVNCHRRQVRRKLKAEVLSKFDPQLHGILKSLLPGSLGSPSPVKFEASTHSSEAKKLPAARAESLTPRAVPTAAPTFSKPTAVSRCIKF